MFKCYTRTIKYILSYSAFLLTYYKSLYILTMRRSFVQKWHVDEIDFFYKKLKKKYIK